MRQLGVDQLNGDTSERRDPILVVRQLSVEIAGDVVLDDITFDLEPGELVALVGPSGSGKSTLLAAVAGLVAPTTGTVIVTDASMWPASPTERAELRRDRIGIVMQFAELLPELTAIENALLPALIRGDGDHQTALISDLFRRLAIDGLENRYPGELSGGERQRVAIARAFAPRPALILADEPTGSLDGELSATVMTDFAALSRDCGGSALIATHDSDIAGRCDRVLTIANSRVHQR